MRTIPLRNVAGEDVAAAFVDDEDFDRINRHRWSFMAGAAHRKVRTGGRNRTVLMHREVMGAGFGDGLAVEHINGNKLDNRRSNLRVRPATTSLRSPIPHARARVEP